MARYSLNLNSIAAANAANYLTIHTSATVPCYITFLMVTLNASTASTVKLGTPANTPVATTSTTGMKLDPNSIASATQMDTAWSTAPTVPANFLEGATYPASAGSGAIIQWNPDAKLYLPASSWLTLWNNGGGTASVLAVTIRWEE